MSTNNFKIINKRNENDLNKIQKIKENLFENDKIKVYPKRNVSCSIIAKKLFKSK